MKKILLFCSLAYVFSTCSTDLDILDDWKETMVVYGLLDTTQAKQYIRIEKAFLGPDNALSMAQNYDSINYMNNLDVWLKELDNNGNLVMAYQLSPDTLMNKEEGIFAFPAQVVYSMPTAGTLPFVATHTFRVEVTNLTTGLMVSANTTLINNFVITRPNGVTIDIRKITPTTLITVEWNGSANARLYQVAGRLHYRERDQNNVITNKVTPDWLIRTVKTTSASASSLQSIDYEPNAFYQFLSNVLVNDPNVSAREVDYFEYVIYAGGEELSTYMDVNGPSSSLAQEKPVYTNIDGGLGLFSSRYQKHTNHMALTLQSEDTLAKGQYTCHLQFLDRNESILNPADLPPGCQ